jgi:ComF family protein
LDTALALCGECLQAGGPRPWRQAVSVFRFHGLARQGIHRFKYRDCPEFAPWFGRLMAEAWGQHGAGMPDVVAPVPLHWLREWRRGYNQAELLARAVAAGLGCPHQKLLRRQHSTKQQAKLHFLERQKNMEGVFRLKPGAEVLRKRVLLVDDVMTTGATLAAAAGPLLAAGAREIGILTAARG